MNEKKKEERQRERQRYEKKERKHKNSKQSVQQEKKIAKDSIAGERTRRKTISKAKTKGDGEGENSETERGMACTTLYTCVYKHLSVYFNLLCPRGQLQKQSDKKKSYMNG